MATLNYKNMIFLGETACFLPAKTCSPQLISLILSASVGPAGHGPCEAVNRLDIQATGNRLYLDCHSSLTVTVVLNPRQYPRHTVTVTLNPRQLSLL